MRVSARARARARVRVTVRVIVGGSRGGEGTPCSHEPLKRRKRPTAGFTSHPFVALAVAGAME